MLAIIGHPPASPSGSRPGRPRTLSGGTIRYNDIDTLGGNSGSGILHGPTGRVVGVHTNGGCNSAGTRQQLRRGHRRDHRRVARRCGRPRRARRQHVRRTASPRQLADDVAGTVHAADTGIRDKIGTILAADLRDTLFSRDVIGTRLTFDVKGTPLALDVGGTPLAGDVIGTLAKQRRPEPDPGEGVVDPDDLWLDPAIAVPSVGCGAPVRAGRAATLGIEPRGDAGLGWRHRPRRARGGHRGELGAAGVAGGAPRPAERGGWR